MNVIIVGAGALGRVLCDFLSADGYTVVAFVDDSPALAGTQVNGVTVCLTEDIDHFLHGEVSCVLAVLDGKGRTALIKKLRKKSVSFFDYKSNSSFVSPYAFVGAGCSLLPFAHVMNAARVGDFCHLHMGTIIGHDAVLGDCCALAPYCSVGGGSKVGRGVTFGMGVNVVPGIIVGEYSILGAGAVVTRNVPPYSIVFGTPSKIHPRFR